MFLVICPNITEQVFFFNSFSSTRLRNVQSLLSNNQQGDDGKPDAILCVLGIDSRYNEGCLELVNYLLFNFFDSRKIELERSGFAEEVIDGGFNKSNTNVMNSKSVKQWFIKYSH